MNEAADLYRNLGSSIYPYELIQTDPGNTPRGATPEFPNTFRVAPENGSRDGQVDATVCSTDDWSSEVYWILLDTSNWWAWGSDGWNMHTAGPLGCQDFSVSVPAGEYMFILADSYGDGGAEASVYSNGELAGMTMTQSGDGMSPYSGLYEAPGVVFGVSDLPTGSDAIEFSIDMNGTGLPNADYDQCGVNGSWNGWGGWGLVLGDDDGDGVFTGTLEAPAGQYEYVIFVQVLLMDGQVGAL